MQFDEIIENEHSNEELVENVDPIESETESSDEPEEEEEEAAAEAAESEEEA